MQTARRYLCPSERLRRALRSHGVDHRDSKWRSILWDERCQHTFMIALEQLVWLTERPNTRDLLDILLKD